MLSLSSVILVALLLWILYVAYIGFRRIESWKFLLKGRHMIREKARVSGDAPFSLPIFGYGERMHVVSTEEHWCDLKNAHVGHLSLHHWVKGMFQPKYSILDVWPDRRDEEGMPIIRAIRTMSNHFPELKPKLLEIFRNYLDATLLNSPKSGDFSQVPLLSTVEYLAVRMNTLLILGEDTANDPAIIKRGIAYSKEVAMIGEAVRLVPKWLASPISRLIKGKNNNQKFMLDTMTRLVGKRRHAKAAAEKTTLPAPITILEAFVDYSPNNMSTREIVHHFNILWTTTTLSLGVVSTQFIQDLYYHTSYAPALVEEICKSQNQLATTPAKQASLLEAFLMESMRTNCFQSTAVHRTALRPFKFSGGYTIPEGESVQFYQEKIHFDEKKYQQAKIFDPSRFHGSRRAVTDVGMEWPFWGVGKNACPGRFYFSFAIQVLASYLLLNFDCELKDPKIKNFTWGENIVPSPKSVLLMKKKSKVQMLNGNFC